MPNQYLYIIQAFYQNSSQPSMFFLKGSSKPNNDDLISMASEFFCKIFCGLQIEHNFVAKYNKQMSQFQLEYSKDIPNIQNRFRTLQFKVKKSKTELQDYDLKEQIGEGGYGRVRKALHKPTGQMVAVKILKVDQCDPEQVQSIQGEILLQQKLMHENIAQIYEVIRKQKKIYIFMEYCPNGELFGKIVKDGPMAEKEAAKIFNQILSALLYLKKMGVSHRDIKPENIIFDKEWNAKLVDFGFSCKSYNEQDKMRRTTCGTPSYTPPEVILKMPYSGELMDIWSLGVTLYTMLASEMPFEGDTPDRKKSKIVNCRWSPKPFFSQRVQRLLSSIFVMPNQRVNLQGLQQSQFIKSYHYPEPNYIDYTKQLIIPQEGVLSILEKSFGMDKKKVSQSLKSYSLDKYRIHYYLTLAKKLNERKNILSDVQMSKYKKQRKSSLTKLQPIVKPQKEKRDESLKVKNTQNLRIRRGSCNLQVPTIRVIRQKTPQGSNLMNNFSLYQ